MSKKRQRRGRSAYVNTSQPQAAQQPARDPAARAKTLRRLRRGFALLATATLVLSTLLCGRQLAGSAARHVAARHIRDCDFGTAFAWLRRADRIATQDPSTELLRAACYRQLHDMHRHEIALQRARWLGAPSAALQNEMTLAQIQSGQWTVGQDNDIADLIDDGLSPHEVAGAFISGYLVQNNRQRAEALWRAWALDYPGHPNPVYFRGVLHAMAGDVLEAQRAFQEALQIDSHHQLAQIALAQQFEATNQPGKAVDIYARLADNLPENETVLLGLARSLRTLGKARAARAALAGIASTPQPLSALAVEMGQIETELGHYVSAREWFDKAAARDMRDHDTLRAAAIALAATGDPVVADQLEQWIIDDQAVTVRRHDLQERMAANPRDDAAADEYQRLLKSVSASVAANPYQSALAAAPQEPPSAGMQLYAEHCATCHGTQGDGDGRAARYLFPRPRNLRDEPLRLVSTRNGIPNDDDIRTVIRNGVPGTSMQPLPDLQPTELEPLVEVVKQMRREGIRSQFLELLQELDEPVDERELAAVIATRTTPGDAVVPPADFQSSAAIVAKGQELYVELTCISCHGENGSGTDAPPLSDDQGRVVFPRDLRHDIFKGGDDPPAIYTRIVAGMPGSPHPATVGVTADQVASLVAYCQSLGQQPKHTLTNHQRAVRATRRRALDFFPDLADGR